MVRSLFLSFFRRSELSAATAMAAAEGSAADCLHAFECDHQLTEHTAAGMTDIDAE